MCNAAYDLDIRYEYYNGIPICMSPRPAVNHAIVSGNIFKILSNNLSGKPCIAFPDGVDVHLDDEQKNWVVPDAMIICNKEIIKKDGVYGVPDLVVEVLSPSTAKNDRRYKKDLYQKYGVKEYWIVSTADQSIEVYILKEGIYQLDEIYAVYPEYMLKTMTAEEQAKVQTKFSPTQFPDMDIIIRDVFEKTL